jgi:hypothetical protein
MIASARMDSWSPSLAAAWHRLLGWVGAAAVVSAIEKAGLQVEHHDPAATLRLVERENEVVRTAARKLGLAK